MIKAVIVDDEESARNVLENLLRRFCPEVEVINTFPNVLQAVDVCKKNPPDLVFLDIEMPNYAGFEIVNFFESVPFEIIFVTAYDKYALRAFEVSAIDYLLKPVDIDRLREAVGRVHRQTDLKLRSEKLALLGNTLQSNEVKNISISDKGYQRIIAVETIIAIEAEESYCTIHTAEKKYTVSKNLKHFETILADNPLFFRAHKSWIVSKNHIDTYSKSELLINLSSGLKARLSKYKKTEFEELLRG